MDKKMVEKIEQFVWADLDIQLKKYSDRDLMKVYKASLLHSGFARFLSSIFGNLASLEIEADRKSMLKYFENKSLTRSGRRRVVESAFTVGYRPSQELYVIVGSL